MTKTTTFKGYPLIDFMQDDIVGADEIFSKPSLMKAVFAFAKTYQPDITSTKPQTTGRHDNIREPAATLPDSLIADSGSRDKPSFEDNIKRFLDGLYLGKFESSVLQPVASRPPLKYFFEIGFNTDKTTGFVVENPLDTLITFEPRKPIYPYENYKKPSAVVMPTMVVGSLTEDRDCDEKRPRSIGRAAVMDFSKGYYKAQNPRQLKNVCDLNFRVTVDHRNDLQEINIYGDSLKVHLSKGLVEPVFRHANGKWERNGERLSFDIGKRVLTLRKNRLPTWGGVIELGGIPVVVTSSNIVARLNKINIGGTPQKPLIVFDDVEIV